ncbi:MAG: Do family serine endopeptidase [Pseudohongiellaceae bacterium]
MKFGRGLFMICGYLWLGMWGLAPVALSHETDNGSNNSLAPMLENVTAAVVSIRVSQSIPTGGQFGLEQGRVPDALRRYFRDQPSPSERRPRATGAGSGVIVDSQSGYVVTNHHVIEQADSIDIQLQDGRVLEASLVGSDESTDIALLQIASEGLTELQFADIDSVHVGDFVVAIGNPFGIGQTVTSGIVSALGRRGLNRDHYEDFIQTDAAINRGNSGGALVNMRGELIGINTAIISGNGGSNGIGFAVPVDMVEKVVEHLERDGEVRRGMLGVTISSLTPELKEAIGAGAEQGAVVTQVLPGSAAEQAGLRVSDVITGIDGHQIESAADLRNIIGLLRRDQQITLSVFRGEALMELSARIGDDNGVATAAVDFPQTFNYRGAIIAEIGPGEHASVTEGVLIDEVRQGSAAWTAGLRQGDAVTAVNRQSISDLNQFRAATEAEPRLKALTVVRGDQTLLLLIS